MSYSVTGEQQHWKIVTLQICKRKTNGNFEGSYSCTCMSSYTRSILFFDSDSSQIILHSESLAISCTPSLKNVNFPMSFLLFCFFFFKLMYISSIILLILIIIINILNQYLIKEYQCIIHDQHNVTIN